MWEGDRKNSGREFFHTSLKHALKTLTYWKYMVKKIKKPSFLDFRLELAAQLIGNYKGRSNIGRPRSRSPVAVRLHNNRSHLPIITDKHIECVVCNKIRYVSGASRSTLRHESQVRCSTCEVALYLSKKRCVASFLSMPLEGHYKLKAGSLSNCVFLWKDLGPEWSSKKLHQL